VGQGAEEKSEKSEKFAQPPVSSRNEGVSSGFQRSHSCAWVGVGVTGDSNARTSSADSRSESRTESRSDFRASAAGSSHTHTHNAHTHTHTHTTPAPHTHTHAHAHAHAHASAAGLSRAQHAQQPQRDAAHAAHAAAPDARGFKDLLAEDLRYEDTYLVVPQVRGHIYIVAPPGTPSPHTASLSACGFICAYIGTHIRV
jgi:hypothetical protein